MYLVCYFFFQIPSSLSVCKLLMPLAVAFCGNPNPIRMSEVETVEKYFSLFFSINQDVYKRGNLYLLWISLQINDNTL